MAGDPSTTGDRSFAVRVAHYPDYPRSSSRPLAISSSPNSPHVDFPQSQLFASNRYHRDGSAGMSSTIRAVTPESEEHEAITDADSESSVPPPLVPPHHRHSPSSSSTPPRTPSRSANNSTSRWDLLGRASPEPSTVHGTPSSGTPGSPEKNRGVFSRAAKDTMNAAAQLAELSINRAKSRSPTERVRRDKDREASPEGRVMLPEHLLASPPQLIANRNRTAGSEPIPLTVGYPSTLSAPVLAPNMVRPGRQGRHRLLKSQNSLSAISSLQTKSEMAPMHPASPVTTAEYHTLVALMKELKGKMGGYMEYRIGEHAMWTRGYMSIHEEAGSLLYQRDELAPGNPTVIVPDLRGCQVRTMEDIEFVIDLSTHSKTPDIKLRPLDVQQYDQWLAALLCWQPIRPAGAQNKLVKPETFVLAQEKRDRRRNSDASVHTNSSKIIKVGRMLLWRPGAPPLSSPQSVPHKTSGRLKTPPGVAWQAVSCTLQENGQFQMYRESDSALLTRVHLSELSRSAVQQLDPSILDQDHCVAIYPQYTSAVSRRTSGRPVYLALDSRILFEVWFVLLRAFTMPELYGPKEIMTPATPPLQELEVATAAIGKDSPLKDSFRIQRSLYLRVMEAKINMANSEKDSWDCYAEVVLDGEPRAKTMVRTKTHNPFWRENYEFPDLPATLTDVSVYLKQRDPRTKGNKPSGSASGSGGYGGGIGGSSTPMGNDVIIGAVHIKLDELRSSETEGWFPLMAPVNRNGDEVRVGEMLLKVELEELTVLMEEEYKGLSELLHDFDHNLTLQLSQIVTDLPKLSRTLLQIFQVSSKASDWLMSLAGSEIDGLHRELRRENLSFGSSSGSASTPGGDDEPTRPSPICFTPAKPQISDANILFRGNTLMTRALDSHMKRLGREFLEDVLYNHLAHIAEEDTYCEVDPNRLGDNSEHEMRRNWRTLLGLTRKIWESIYGSSARCPIELRKILRHIRSCVAVRYADDTDALRTVSYSSVCGFLFLRFFCPAILNPKLFGLLKDHPGVRAQRTLTLIAKSLQGLANLTTFGQKEPWMSPMNSFLDEHTAELKDFIDSITTIPSVLDKAPRTVPPSYATPITILSRLSPSSKEGFPSLPYLIDQQRAYAALVVMWNRHRNAPVPPTLAIFDETIEHINRRIIECRARAEPAESPARPNAALERRWEEIAEAATGFPGRSSGMRDGYFGGPIGRNAGERVESERKDWPGDQVAYSSSAWSGAAKERRGLMGVFGRFGGKRE